jgi:hypothetical protein
MAFGASSYIEVKSGGSNIGFSFRTDQIPEQRATFLRLVHFIDNLLPSTLGFKFVSQVTRDAPFMRELASERYRSGRQVSFHETDSDVDSTFDVYADCRFIVSNRLHALLSGLIAGAHPMAVVDGQFNRKIAGLFDSLKLSIVRPDGPGSLAHELAGGDYDEANALYANIRSRELLALEHAVSEIFH